MADLAPDAVETGLVIGAHWAAEDNDTCVIRNIERQVATEAGETAFQHITATLQQFPDPSRCRQLLMQNNQDRILASLLISHRTPIRQFPGTNPSANSLDIRERFTASTDQQEFAANLDPSLAIIVDNVGSGVGLAPFIR